MKTINVEELTWKTLQEMKLKWGLPTMEAVINRLIVECVQKDGAEK